VYEQETVRVADMAGETRWPKFTARAREAGAAGMLPAFALRRLTVPAAPAVTKQVSW